MRADYPLLLLLRALSSTTTWAAQFPPRQDLNEAAAPSEPTPRRWIIELQSRAHGAGAAARVESLSGVHMVKQFDSDLFPAVSVECENECDSSAITAALEETDEGPVVVSVYKSALVRILPTYEEGESYSDDAAAANYSVHGLTGVDKLHGAGILGEGATVAIVDSGVQYTHPALGGGIGQNFTVIGGYDLVGDGDWPDTPPEPDNDPIDRYGHGTHVAGIVAGKSEQFVGVAPNAKLLSYKTFSNGGYSNEETVIEGFLMAFDSGADIISASLGEAGGFTTNAWAVVASRMVQQGVVVVIAAGNSGQDGPFDASNGASGKNVLTIASAEPGLYPAQGFTADFILDGTSNRTEVAYIPDTTTGFFPATIVDWPIVPITLNSSVENDACTALPAGTPDLTGVIVLIRIGGCSVYDKQTNVIAFNASTILFYNDDGPYVSPAAGSSTIRTGAIEATAGKAIIDTILSGGNVTASFDLDTGHYVGLRNSAGAGRPARYTSFGGTYELALKPDVAAPGSKILSTYPTDAYKVLSGTSMATPYIAGIAALWVSKYGGRAAHADDPAWAARLIARIMSTAKAVPWADWSTSATDYGFWAPTTQMGAGLVDAERILGYTTNLNFEGRKFELNDTANFAGTHSVDITNSGSETVTYTFSLQDAGGFEAYIPSIPGTFQSFIPKIKSYVELTSPIKMTPEVAMPQSVFTVGPGETRTAEFAFTAPTGLNATNLPVYSGKILISGNNGEELGIPYFGVACDLKKTIENIWHYGNLFPFLTSTTSSTRIASKSNFTFNLTTTAQDFPHFNAEFAYGTAEFRWDIFDANYSEALWTYPPVVGEAGFVGSATRWSTGFVTQFDPETDSEDDIYPFPLYDMPRDLWTTHFWLGRLANGSTILPGAYNMRIATLRPFGVREVSADWDIWETPQITVLPLL